MIVTQILLIQLPLIEIGLVSSFTVAVRKILQQLMVLSLKLIQTLLKVRLRHPDIMSVLVQDTLSLTDICAYTDSGTLHAGKEHITKHGILR